MPDAKAMRDHEIGPRRARVTLLEYGDFECPYCGSAHPRVEQIRRLFGDDLKFVFRNFPLEGLHPNAMNAARAAEAAARQKSFWPMYDILFENQDELDEAALFGYADEVGLNMEKFARDFASKSVFEKIRRDISLGERDGVSGTPSFYINGEKFEGSWSDEEFVEALRGAARQAARGHRVRGEVELLV